MKKTIKITETDLNRIIKRVIKEQEDNNSYELDFGPETVKVFSNEGFKDIEDKDAVEVIIASGSVNRIPNLDEFPNLFIINCSECAPLVDIDVYSLLRNPNLIRVIFKYTDSPTMKYKVKTLLKKSEEIEKPIQVDAKKIGKEKV